MATPAPGGRGPRAQITVPCTIRRRIGAPVAAETVDVGPDGMRVRTTRPLAPDESVHFDLPNFDMRISGRAHVQHVLDPARASTLMVNRLRQMPAGHLRVNGRVPPPGTSDPQYS